MSTSALDIDLSSGYRPQSLTQLYSITPDIYGVRPLPHDESSQPTALCLTENYHRFP